ncbi:MAG: flavodoxin-dependent (E)-4-hydroxy-3-methylbut-2-enyl-diphosphate synthase, partial [Clostridia bacterium]|nr:flavodoxin-dependent (E)-4-hydroxy-3-methylbut-2-enyl-diphosphate synthase [Clostridia bacterium]
MTKQITVGNVKIGGGAPIAVQSMTTTKTWDAEATLRQIYDLADAHCDIVRVTLNTPKAVEAFGEICARSPLPVVADIHYDPSLALAAVRAGAAKIRLNPGNIKPQLKEEIATLCKSKGVPIRIGVNMGSLDSEIEAQYGRTANAMVYSALKEAKAFNQFGFDDLCISVKASDPKVCYEAYKTLHAACTYPLHLGVTEAGAGQECLAKSYSVIGGLLLEGIGDTIRVSMTDDP